MVYAEFVSTYRPSFYGSILQGGRSSGGQLWLQNEICIKYGKLEAKY